MSSKRGFASMDPDKQREASSKGGKTARDQGKAHKFTSEEAREAGRKGGIASGASRRGEKKAVAKVEKKRVMENVELIKQKPNPLFPWPVAGLEIIFEHRESLLRMTHFEPGRTEIDWPRLVEISGILNIPKSTYGLFASLNLRNGGPWPLNPDYNVYILPVEHPPS